MDVWVPGVTGVPTRTDLICEHALVDKLLAQKNVFKHVYYFGFMVA